MNKIEPSFRPGGKLAKLESVYDGMETFLFTPNTTSRSGVHIHDGNDLKRTMITVVVALIPALLFGMYNIGYQHYLAIGQPETGWFTMFLFGLLALLPVIVVSYAVGLGIEFISAQIHHKEIQEGFLVTGILIPLIVPINTPLWMTAVATAFAVIFAKEVFGGTGMNIFNVALITRAFLFFSYPSRMSGDEAFVKLDSAFGMGGGTVADTFTGARHCRPTHQLHGCLYRLHPWFAWRDLDGRYPDWRHYPAPDRHCLVEDHVLGICRRSGYGCSGACFAQRHLPRIDARPADAVVSGRICLWRRVYGN